MPISPPQILTGVLAAAAVAFLSYRSRLLNRSGAWATLLLGSVVFGLGGIAWSVPLLVFFVLSSLLSRFGPKRKRRVLERLELTFEKGSTRDAMQVLANGGVAGIALLVHAALPSGILAAAYLGALAAAAADTWATEVGVMARRARSIVTLRPVPTGTSGGISTVGSIAALAGAASVGASGVLLGDPFDGMFPAACAAGFAGMLADSLLGATLQAQYRCTACGALTERRVHCNAPATLASGHPAVTNDVVNIACCLVGAAVAALLSLQRWG